MRNPLFHRSHRDAVDIIPKLNFVILIVLVMDNGTFVDEGVGKDKSFFV